MTPWHSAEDIGADNLPLHICLSAQRGRLTKLGPRMQSTVQHMAAQEVANCFFLHFMNNRRRTVSEDD